MKSRVAGQRDRDFDGLRQRGLRRLPPRRAVDAGGAAEAGSAPGPRCSISPVSLELGYLTFCLFPINSVAFLDLSNEPIALPFDDLPVIVGQSFPGLLCLSDELFPSSFGLVSVHLEAPATSNRVFKTAQKSLGSPLPASRRLLVAHLRIPGTGQQCVP